MRAEEEERVDDFLLNITCLPVDWNKNYTLLQWTATRTYFTESKVFHFLAQRTISKWRFSTSRYELKVKQLLIQDISITNDSITYLLLLRFNFLEFNYAVRSTRDLNQRSISKAKLTGHGLFHLPDHLGLRHFPIHHSQRPLRQSLDSRWRFGRTRIPLHARLGKIEV